VLRNRLAHGTCPAAYCPGTGRCRLTYAVTYTTNCPSTESNSSTLSLWCRTIAVPPSSRCTTVQKRWHPVTGRPGPEITMSSTPCCTTTEAISNKPKLIQISIIDNVYCYHEYRFTLTLFGKIKLQNHIHCRCVLYSNMIYIII